jgi:hypothetical protein
MFKNKSLSPFSAPKAGQAPKAPVYDASPRAYRPNFATAQSKMAPPPVYRPNLISAQAKMTAPTAYRPNLTSAQTMIATPPVYRPNLISAQAKMAPPPVYRPNLISAQAKMAAPAVYRPDPISAQAKMAAPAVYRPQGTLQRTDGMLPVPQGRPLVAGRGALLRPRQSVVQCLWKGNGDYRTMAGYTALNSWEKKWVDDYISKNDITAQAQWQKVLGKLKPYDPQLVDFMTYEEARGLLETRSKALEDADFTNLENRMRIDALSRGIPDEALTKRLPTPPHLPPNIKPRPTRSKAFPIVNKQDKQFRDSSVGPSTAVRVDLMQNEANQGRLGLHKGVEMVFCSICCRNVLKSVMQTDHQVAWKNLSGRLALLVADMNADTAAVAAAQTAFGIDFNRYFVQQTSGTWRPSDVYMSDFSNDERNLYLICSNCNTIGAKKAEEASQWYRRQALFGKAFLDYASNGQPLNYLGQPSVGEGFGAAAREWTDNGPAHKSIETLRQVDLNYQDIVSQIGSLQNEHYVAKQDALLDPSLAPQAKQKKRLHNGALASTRHLSKTAIDLAITPEEQEGYSSSSEDEAIKETKKKVRKIQYERSIRKEIANAVDQQIQIWRHDPLKVFHNSTNDMALRLEQRRRLLRRAVELFFFENRPLPKMEPYESVLCKDYRDHVNNTYTRLLAGAQNSTTPPELPEYWSAKAKGLGYGKLRDASEAYGKSWRSWVPSLPSLPFSWPT